MRRRRLLLGLLALTVFAGAGVALLAWLAGPRHRIWEVANQPGLLVPDHIVRDRAHAFIGVPPGDYSGGAGPKLREEPDAPTDYRFKDEWRANDAFVRIYFAGDGRMLSVSASVEARETFWERVRRWLRLTPPVP